MAGNLCFKAKLVRERDMDVRPRRGRWRALFPAEQIHAMTLANLSGEFAEIVTAAEIGRRLDAA